MFLPLLSPGQYLIFVFIAYCFVLGLEPSYLEKRGDVVGIHLVNSLLGTG